MEATPIISKFVRPIANRFHQPLTIEVIRNLGDRRRMIGQLLLQRKSAEKQAPGLYLIFKRFKNTITSSFTVLGNAHKSTSIAQGLRLP